MLKKELKKGINLYTVKDDKFKAFAAYIIIHRPLNKKEVTLNTLMATVMKMKSKNYPSQSEISKELENLYGAKLFSYASKYGERQLIKIGIQSVCDSVLSEDENFEKAMKLLYDIVLCQDAEGGFSEDIIEIEKKNIKDAILAQKNDKRTYSTLRLQEEMCKDEAYGINPMGYIEELEKADTDKLYEHYKKVISQSRIDIIFSGNFDEEKALKAAKNFSSALKERDGAQIKEEIRKAPESVKSVTDKMDVTQGKLCMGWRMENTEKEDYPALIVYNSIFGGSAVSKLFNNVREKLSLCYYVGSSIDRLKKIMIVRSGVEFENFGKAYDEIMLQQKMMTDGDFTDEEIENAKRQLIAAYRSNLDSIGLMAEYYIMQILLETDISIEQMCQEVGSVSREKIIEAAKRMKLDTVYYIDKE